MCIHRLHRLNFDQYIQTEMNGQLMAINITECERYVYKVEQRKIER